MSEQKTSFSYTGKDVVLSLQHMFAMLGATITVPLVCQMNIPLALISAGIGTILFYFLTKRKVPVFLGSSFAFMPGLITIMSQNASESARLLAIMLSVVAAGLVYVIFSYVIKAVGVQKIKKLFPPIVVGPVIIIIGMNLAGSIFWNDIVARYICYGSVAWKEWTTAIITALTIILVNAFAKPKSFLKVIPILLGFVVGYIYGACIGLVDWPTVFAGTMSGEIIIFQQATSLWAFWGAWGELDGALIGTAMLSIVPIAVVTFMEHLGDISANSTVCGKDFMVDPGLDRTVLGDGVATIASALIGGPANTTYGENTAVLAITQNYKASNIFLAACFAVVLGLFVPFGELLGGLPMAVVGGACVVLFGMISASGLRSLVDSKVDFSNTKNLIVVSVTLAVGLGLGALSLGGDIVSSLTINGLITNLDPNFSGNALKIGFAVSGGGFVQISPLAISTLLAIVLNLIIPSTKKESDERIDAEAKTNVSLTNNITDAVDIAETEEK